MPITWKNVDAGESRTGVALLQGAQQNITAGLDGLKGLVDDRVEMKDANIRNERTNNTKAFAEELATYRDFDEYEAALDSGAIDALRTKYGANVDSPEMLKLQNAQTASLRKELREDRLDTTSENTFDTAQLKLKTDPLVEKVNSFIQNGQYDEAKGLIAENQNIFDRANLTSGLYQRAEDREIEVTNRDRAEAEYDSTKTLTSVTSDESVVRAATENDAVAAAIKLADTKTISASDMLQVVPNARKAWLDNNDVSQRDSDNISAYQTEEDEILKAELDVLNNTLKVDLANYPVDANVSFFSDAENNFSLGDAMNLADKNNYDKTAWIGSNKSVIEDTYKSVGKAFLDERKKSVKAMNESITEKNALLAVGDKKTPLIKIPTELSSKDNRALNNIMYMAVGDMGDGLDEGYIFDTKQELDDGPFGGLKARTTALMQQYLDSVDNQEKRDAAKKFHADATREKRNASAANVFTYSASVRQTAKDVQTGMQQVRQAVKNPRNSK